MVPQSADELLELARPLFQQHGSNLMLAEFCRATGVSRSRIVRDFGGWIGLKAALGYPPVGAHRVRSGPSLPDAAILDALKRLVPETGEGITLNEFTRRTDISSSRVYRQFGSWTELRRQAGLSQHAPARRVFTDEQILLDVFRVATLTNKYVTQDSYAAHGRIGLHTLIRRFGSFSAAMTAFAEYSDEFHHRLPDESDRASYLRSHLDPLHGVRPKSFPPPNGQLRRTSRMSLPLREGEMEWSKFNRFIHKSTFDTGENRTHLPAPKTAPGGTDILSVNCVGQAPACRRSMPAAGLPHRSSENEATATDWSTKF